MYDDNGRLLAVVAPNSGAKVYEYNAAASPIAIRRNVATALEVLDISPRKGVRGGQ